MVVETDPYSGRHYLRVVHRVDFLDSEGVKRHTADLSTDTFKRGRFESDADYQRSAAMEARRRMREWLRVHEAMDRKPQVVTTIHPWNVDPLKYPPPSPPTGPGGASKPHERGTAQ